MTHARRVSSGWRIAPWVTRVGAVVRRLIGAPDYDGYVAHRRLCHPGEPLLSRQEFYRLRLEDRYSRPGNRCC
ncbi:MAG TPA: YbdD/YjiX family protein [Gemmatimonadaceae bacterium]|nr:YbdD/YjiX family protein [Gemmatimonadaceae bacterium]